MKLGLLVVLAVVVLVPRLSEGRIVSKCELKNKLAQEIILPTRLQTFKKRILDIAVCVADRRSSLDTGLVIVDGKRLTTTVMSSTPTTEPTNDVKMIIEPRQISPSKMDMSLEEQLNESEGEEKRRKYMNRFSLFFPSGSTAYYGLFLLSDSFFCDSGYRRSRNLCNTSCGAFTDDDITDDIECLVKTGYFWYLVRRPVSWCDGTEKLNEC